MVNSIYNYPNNNGVVSGVPKQPKQKQNFGQGVSVPVGTQNDTFVSSQTKQVSKEGMSTGTKWAIGLGLTALVGAGIYLATRGKVKSSIPRQLAENIQFNPAQTLDEAAAFAKNNFGIEKFDVQDLGMANYINEGFTIASNKVKGKIVMPDIVKSAEGDFIAQVYNSFGGKRVMEFNPKGASWDSLYSYLPTADDLTKRGWSPEHIKGFLEDIKATKLKYEKGSFVERVNIAHEIQKNWYARVGFGKYHDIFHELGHLHHDYVSPELHNKFAKAGTGLAFKKARSGSIQSKLIAEHAELLLNADLKIKDIGIYAFTYPNEFVAEMYAHMLSGKKLRPELMEIYKKYGGPMI